MSKLGCICGHTIHDQTTDLPYKASLLRDPAQSSFFDWLIEETESYVSAVQNGEVEAWLLEKGYGPDYVSLKLSHGNILHDHIHAQYDLNKRDLYQCINCGRVLIETSEPDKFASYSPDDRSKKDLLNE